MNKEFTSNKIKLVYWNKPNFGDMLSPYVISELSGKDIIYKNTYHGTKHSIKKLILYILSMKINEIQSISWWWEKTLLGIGSIISFGHKHSAIWGSGFINENQHFNGGTVYAVRGRYTDNKLKEEGFRGTSVYGDPALLVPLIISPSKLKINDIAIIPHWSETEYFIEKYGKKYKIIDLRTRDIKNVIEQITSCNRILSTSLHGIIVSHAYGVPALWIKHKNLHESNFKFYDYFSSVGIKEYEGLINIDEILSSKKNYMNCFGENAIRSLPNIDLKLIQNKLICSAPFNIQHQYKSFK